MYYEEKEEKDLLMFATYLAYSYFCPARLKSILTHHSGQKKQKQMNKEKSPKEKKQNNKKYKAKKHNNKQIQMLMKWIKIIHL